MLVGLTPQVVGGGLVVGNSARMKPRRTFRYTRRLVQEGESACFLSWAGVRK